MPFDAFVTVNVQQMAETKFCSNSLNQNQLHVNLQPTDLIRSILR